MSSKRISGQERKKLILLAARRIFSQYGYEGAKTLQIAREAKVSEALVYRHYPSKMALYRAVLRQIFREQNANFRSLGIPSNSTESIVRALRNYFTSIIDDPHGEMQEGYRMTLASVAGDGNYASLLYRRSLRRTVSYIAQAHQAAREAGDLQGEALDIADTAMFIEHIGTMMTSICRLDQAARPYASDGRDLAREAVWFCCRGIGLTDAAIARYYDT